MPSSFHLEPGNVGREADVMTTPNIPPRSRASRPLRLRMAPDPGAGVMDGGWWPRSRELVSELGELVDHLPVEHGRVVRASFSPPDWDTSSRGIPTATGAIKAGSSAQDNAHLIVLTLADRRTLQLLVVPPALSQEQGEEALLAAATPGYAHSARCLLTTVTNSPDHDEADHWIDDVEAGATKPAGPQRMAPEHR
jgi:hypothetical protein